MIRQQIDVGKVVPQQDKSLGRWSHNRDRGLGDRQWGGRGLINRDRRWRGMLGSYQIKDDKEQTIDMSRREEEVFQ